MPNTKFLASYEKEDLTSLAMEFAIYNAYGSPDATYAISMPAEGPRGLNCLKLGRGGLSNYVVRSIGLADDFTFGVRIKLSNVNATQARVLSFTSSDGRLACALYVNLGNTLAIGMDGGVVWYGATALLPNVWYYFEGVVKRHASAGSVAGYLNGRTLPDGPAATGNTKPYSNTIPLMWLTGRDSGYTWIADHYVTDSSTAGEKWNSTRVSGYVVNGAGQYSQLSSQNGGANYTNVDEATLSTTDYVYGTPGNKDTYSKPALGFSASTIRSVCVRMPMRVLDATDAQVALTTYNTATTNNNDHPTPVSPALDYTTACYILDQDPDTDAAWTQEGYEDTEVGPKVQ